jgi:hypothetical protein
MMAWAEHRLNVNQIKQHPFFYGVDWTALRLIEPPFVPHLKSITDTSYFPTDEFGDVPDQLDQAESVGAEKDLAFLLQVISSRVPPNVLTNFHPLASLSNDPQAARRRESYLAHGTIVPS